MLQIPRRRPRRRLRGSTGTGRVLHPQRVYGQSTNPGTNDRAYNFDTHSRTDELGAHYWIPDARANAHASTRPSASTDDSPGPCASSRTGSRPNPPSPVLYVFGNGGSTNASRRTGS